MILSEDRVSHLAHLVIDGIWDDDLVDYTDDEAALRAGKRGLSEFVKDVEEVERRAHAKVASLKRGVVEGSPEWDVLFGKYFEEEMQKRGDK
jgi:hypothetical protein